MAEYRLALRELIVALGSALDYVGIDDVYHGRRVAVMAYSCAQHAGWPDAELQKLLIAGLLHDCGVSSTDVHRHLVSEWSWPGVEAHALRGETLLANCALLAEYARVVRYHHTDWRVLQTLDEPEWVKRHANLLFLVDRADALRAQWLRDSPPDTVPPVTWWGACLARHAGQEFDPALCALFSQVSGNDAFWLQQEGDAMESFFDDWCRALPAQPIPFAALNELGLMFARIVDSKSPFTSTHSHGVQAVASALAQQLGLPAAEQEAVTLAALLHDLGKLRISDALLHKQAAFTEAERQTMRRHAYDTWLILKRIHGFEEIARLAAMHHETLDGHGYPEGLGASALPLAARLIAVADVFQALVQNRPYRASLSLQEVQGLMLQMVIQQKLDPDLVGLLFEAGEHYQALARQAELVVTPAADRLPA